MERIIIVGGMGPQASLELHRRILRRASENGATDGGDFPHIVHLSLPINDFISNEALLPLALRTIIDNLKQLEPTADDKVVIACNTAHLLAQDIEREIGTPIVSLINAATEYIQSNCIKRVHLAATPTTLRTGLYEMPIAALGTVVSTPGDSERRYIESIIRGVIAGHGSRIDRTRFADDVPLLLGCTELSCASTGARNVIDPLDLVVDTLLPKV